MKKKPAISVILINYNNGDYVADAIKSIIFQTFQDWECVIVDDGSTDNSREIIKKLTANDKRFKLIFQKNRGGSAARNVGLRNTTGEYIMFLDSDDCYTPIAMQVLLKNALEYGCDLVSGHALMTHNDFKFDLKQKKFDHIADKVRPFFITTSNDVTGEYFRYQDRKRVSDTFRFVWIWTKLFRQDLLAGKFFPEDLFPGEDTLFMLEVIRDVKKIAQVDCPVTYHRISKTSSVNAGVTLSNTTYNIETIKRARQIMTAYPEDIRENTLKALMGLMFRDMIIKTMKHKQFRNEVANEIRKTYGTDDFPKKYLKWRARIMLWFYLKSFPEQKEKS